MTRRTIGLLVALLLTPFPAEAGKKTILRFEKETKPAAKEEAAPARQTPDVQAPMQEGSPAPPAGEPAPPGDVAARPDWYGEKFSEGKAETRGAAPGGQGAESTGLPGTPAEEEETTPVPRPSGRVRATPVAPPPELPVAAPAPRKPSTPGSVAIPAAPAVNLPQRPEPFTYAPVSPGAITPRGYAPSVAPPGEVRIPATAPVVSGRPPARPRALPRLAPYGTALPPDQTEPPAALPR